MQVSLYWNEFLKLFLINYILQQTLQKTNKSDNIALKKQTKNYTYMAFTKNYNYLKRLKKGHLHGK